MRLKIENAEAGKTQRTYARLAGILFLGVILIALVGGFILSRVAGSGTFAETATRIAASERLYRVALSTVVIANPLGSALLAFALYATLRPVNRLLANRHYLQFGRFIPSSDCADVQLRESASLHLRRNRWSRTDRVRRHWRT